MTYVNLLLKDIYLPSNTDQSLMWQSNEPVIAILDTFVRDIFFLIFFDWFGFRRSTEVTLLLCPEKVLITFWRSMFQTFVVVSALKEKNILWEKINSDLSATVNHTQTLKA